MERIEKRLDKKLSKFDAMPEKRRIKNYNRLLSNINNVLQDKELLKKDRVIYSIMKEIVIKRMK
jgi:hypothetical protein